MSHIDLGTPVGTAPAAAADGVTNPTVAGEAAYLMVFNGTTWDRVRSAATAGGAVTIGNLATVQMMGTAGANMLPVLTAQTNTDASTGGAFPNTGPMLYNGATYDRQRNSIEATLLASAARTTTQTSADITVYNARFLRVILDMTTVGTGDVTVTINGKDSASGKYFLLLAGTNITTNSTNVYSVGVGLTVAANVAANNFLPRIIQIVVTANNANSATYSVGYQLSV